MVFVGVMVNIEAWNPILHLILNSHQMWVVPWDQTLWCNDTPIWRPVNTPATICILCKYILYFHLICHRSTCLLNVNTHNSELCRLTVSSLFYIVLLFFVILLIKVICMQLKFECLMFWELALLDFTSGIVKFGDGIYYANELSSNWRSWIYAMTTKSMRKQYLSWFVHNCFAWVCQLYEELFWVLTIVDLKPCEFRNVLE